MAPMTRRSQANTGIAKKVHRKRGSQPPAAKRQTSDSWELLDREGLNGHQHEDTPDEQDEDQLALTGPMDVQSAIVPLREMADRIGTEVEAFAQNLDQMLAELHEHPDPSDSQKFEWATKLVQEFSDIAKCELFTGGNNADKNRQLRKEWSNQARLSVTSNALDKSSMFKSSLLGEKKAQQVKEARDLQQESDLWELLKIMLELRPFAKEAEEERQERKRTLKNMGPAHRYTSESELWDHFLLSNEVAVERKKVKEWLERSSERQDSDMFDIVEELEKKAGRGKGLWTSGWMHTREKIKGEKRLRNWPSDTEANLPQIRRADDNDLLVARLDPDAPTRQQRVLEKPDAYFERAIWIACWEMLRRGNSWQDICQWCEQRKEGWRASCMGLAADTQESGSSRAAWRHLCRLAAQSGCSSDYEAAVFGLLGGDEEAVKKISRSVNDRIYAFYNSKLLRAFDSFVLSVNPDNAMFSQWNGRIDANALESRQQGDQATSDLLARLRKESATKDETLQPMKVIQSYILADEVPSLINTVGIMVGEAARAQDAEGVIFFRSRKPVNVDEQAGEREVALDPQTLRMAAHMSILFRVLRIDPLEGDDLLEDDNIVVAYIQALRMAGKRDLIPMYASRLQEDRYTLVLGRVLQDISEGEEQNRMLRLLQDYNLDVIQILNEHLDIAFKASFDSAGPLEKSFRMLERTAETKLHPGQRIIVGFLSDEVTQADEALVTALQWYQLYHGHWEVTFKALTEALVRCLLHNNLPCARLIIQTFPSSTISLRKSHEATGTALDLTDSSPSAPIPSSPHDKMTQDLMRRQCRTYHELEFLVRAIEALAHWREEEDTYIAQAFPKPTTVPASLKEAKVGVTEAMEVIVGGVLLHPRDEQEADNLSFIRRMYIPEIVIAYNTVLHAAGNVITRDALLESMDLSVAIASQTFGGKEARKGGNGLAEAFQAAGRMRELVDSFALTSKVMLVLKAEGKPWKARRDREGKELGVWEIGRREGSQED